MILNKIGVFAIVTLLPITAFAEGKEKTMLAEPTARTASAANSEEQEDKTTVSKATDYTKKQAIVVTKRTSLLRGEKYEADIIMLHPNPQCTYKTFIDDMEIVDGRFSKICNSVGNIKYKGYILETNTNGVTQNYPFEGEFWVTEPVVKIENATMSVVYTGVENYIDVQVPGFSTSELFVSFANASSKARTPSGFKFVPVKTGSICMASVYASIDGKNIFLGGKDFLTAPLPTPQAYITVENKTYGNGIIDKETLLLANEVVAKCNLNYLFKTEPSFVVLGFDLKIYGKKGGKVYHSDSGLITDQMKRALSGLKKGDTVYVTNIVAKPKGRGGKEENLSPMEVIIK